MTSDKKSESEDTNMTDYANLAFNPYAISTDDLTFNTFGRNEKTKDGMAMENAGVELNPYAISTDDLTSSGIEPTNHGKAMENGGFEPSPYAISTDDLTFIAKNGKAIENGGFIEDNPHYEDTLEVVKKAGLGRRRKENIVYEAAGYKKKPKTEKRPEPPIRSTNVSPRPAEDWSGISNNTRGRWKLPFLILCLLVLVCLVGTALGVLAYFDDNTCSCNTPQTQQLGQGNSTSRLNDIEHEFTKNVREIFGRLDTLTARLDALETKQREYSEEFAERKSSVDIIHQELTSAIQTVNSTFNIKLKNLNFNVSSLSKDLIEVDTDLTKVNNFTQQLSNTLEEVNSTLTTQLKNISKQRGSQGLQGPQGVGNLSACIVDERTNRNEIQFPKLQKVVVPYKQRSGWKVISAACTSREGAGSIQAELSTKNDDEFTCSCAGLSDYGLFKPIADEDGKVYIECVIIFWECPVLT